jgi:hypothetical protein
MYKINDTFSISVSVNDKDFPLDGGNALMVAHIHASSISGLPLLNLQILDGLNIMPNFGLTDGSSLVVSIKGTITETRKFKVHNWTKVPNGQGFTYNIDGYWDAPMWFAGTSNKGIQGTSGSVIAKIAQMTGLKVYWPAVGTDFMTWFPGNSTFGEFAKEIARHGYISDASHMVLAVDSLGYVRYRDINASSTPKATLGYVKTGNNFITITAFGPNTKSGMNNMVAGYRHTRQLQSVIAESEKESALTFKSPSKTPILSSEVRNDIGRGFISYSALDSGNVHKSYERALYQNTRFNLLYSMTGEFLTPVQTGLEALDVISYVEGKDHTEDSGTYTLKGKVILVAGSTYQEKLMGLKNGQK